MAIIYTSKMNYFRNILRILQLDSTVYKELFAAKLALSYCIFSVAFLGLIYGISSLYFSKALLAGTTPVAVSLNPALIIFVGISVAFLMQVFCRGIGGNPQFLNPYINLGIAGIALWPLAPAVSAIQAGFSGILLYGYTVVASIYALAVCFVAVKEASNLSYVKMTIAVAATMIYIGCFLYLWL
jgi:hypothetical protein